MYIFRKLALFFFIFLILLVFTSWFLPGIITGGDKLYEYPSMLDNMKIYPYAWAADQGWGTGGFSAPFLSAQIVIVLEKLLFLLHLPWDLIERIVEIFPFLILSGLSSFFLFKKFFPENKFMLLNIFLYVFNTYILMILGGGNFLIALSYAIMPFVFLQFFKIINRKISTVSLSVLAGFILAIQVMFDLRIAFTTFVAIVFYFLLTNGMQLSQLGAGIFKKIVYIFIIPGIIVFLLNAFWLFPSLFVHENPIAKLGLAYSTDNAVIFFSFAKFENSIALLHPNWPENIFGKVNFMQPEFLLIPLLAYGSLWSLVYQEKKYIKKEQTIVILFFTFLGLCGAFLAKGANEPFGNVYIWMFKVIPGFNVFRDPTKWYVWVALSYSVLIPYCVNTIYIYLKHLSYESKD